MGAVDLITGEHEDDNPLYLSSTGWLRWFAWHPVVVHDEKIWLKFVYRRRSGMRFEKWGRAVYSAWEYGSIFDVMRFHYDLHLRK